MTEPNIKLLNLDCLPFMRGCMDKEFDLAIVDPPYSETFNTNACANNKGKKGDYNIDPLNGHLPTDEYWTELFRISKNQIIWGANWYGKYFGVGGICWDKDNTGNYSPCEYAYQSFNNHIHIYKYRWNGMLQQNMKNKEERIHPTQKPKNLYKWILDKFAVTGDKILDTHLGSGSIALACYDLKFDFTGLEIDKGYFDKASKRLKVHKQQLTLV
jgi:site-specific DNA-methyltransferase (adenine-specific)